MQYRELTVKLFSYKGKAQRPLKSLEIFTITGLGASQKDTIRTATREHMYWHFEQRGQGTEPEW